MDRGFVVESCFDYLMTDRSVRTSLPLVILLWRERPWLVPCSAEMRSDI